MAVTADKVIVRLEAKVDQYMRDMARSQARFDRNMSDMRRSADRMEANVSRSMRKASASAGQMSRDIRMAVSGVALGLAIREVTQYADAWTEAGNKIAAAGTPLDKQGERLSELADLAIDTRSAFDATASLYARLGIATETLTDKNYDLLKVTELINKATVAGGASTSERNSTVLQLSQALASGELMGEELRSLRENAPILLRAIAKEFEVPIGALKELGAEGKLTSERILDAILNAEGEIAARFAKTDVTIGDSLTNLRTRVTEYLGSAGAATGASATLADAINHVANNVEAYGEALVIALAATTAFGAAKLSQFFAGEIGALRTSIALHNARIEFLRSERLAQQQNAEATVRSTQARIAEIKTTQSQVAASMSLARTQKAEALAYYDLQRGLAAAGQGTGQLTAAKANLAAASRTVIQLQRLERGVAAELTAARAAEAAATTTAGVRKEQYNSIVARTGIVSRAAAAGSRILSGALALVGGPVGLAILGFTALTALVVKFTRDANRAAKEVDDNFNRVLADADAAIEAASNYVDPFGEAGDSAEEATPLVRGLTSAVREYTDALNDATVAKFIQDADELQRSIADTRGEIARLEAERAKIANPSQSFTFGDRSRLATAAEEGRQARLSEVNQQLGIARAKEAGLQQYQASIAVNVLPDDFMAKFIKDPQGAIDELKAKLPEPVQRPTVAKDETAKERREREARIEAAKKSLQELDDAFKTTYQIERDEAGKTFDQQIKAMDELGIKGQERRNRELQAEIAYRNEIDRINAEEAAEIKKIEDERIRAKEEQTDREIDLLRQVLDARDQLSGRYFAIMEREFERKRELIFEEIKDEERRHEALMAMAEERRLAEQEIRDQTAGRGEYSFNREVADITRAQRDGAERSGDVDSKLGMDLSDLRARYEEERSLVAEDDEARLAMLEGFLETEREMILDAEEMKRAIWLESAQLQAAAVEQGLAAATGAMRQAFNEQSGIYKAFFVLQKGAAIAAAAIATQQNIAEASKVGFPQNIAFMAAAAAQGATILANMQAIQATFGGGRERGGPVRPDEFYEVNEKGKPELLNANGKYYLMSGGYGKVEPANAMPSVPDLSRLTQPILPQMQSSSQNYTINSPVTIQGSVDRETLPDLMRELNARDERILERARQQAERDQRNTTPRHQRDRFWKG